MAHKGKVHLLIFDVIRLNNNVGRKIQRSSENIWNLLFYNRKKPTTKILSQRISILTTSNFT